MWSTSEEPPGPMEGGPPPSQSSEDEPGVNLKESCEQSKSQLESLKDIMLRNKQSLRKKEEEIQEYARKLTKFKTRAKLSKRKNKDENTSGESTPKSIISDVSSSLFSETIDDDDVDDISQAKTPKAKSSLLQRKLAEDKKIFEQRRSEITESKRAVEEKVEAIRQQLDEREQQLPITPVVLSQGAAPLIQMSFQQDKDNKIAELSNRIVELEAINIDLRENLREKDSVIDSKTKAVTLMSADLSLKGKTTLDTLEDTKDEMRTMQEHFILLETSLRSKNDNLLEQLQEKTDKTIELEETLNRLQDQLNNQKIAELATNDFSRSTMDTLADTKDAMKSMQENFILVETSLKTKIEHLLQQLEEREIKLAESKEIIFKLESNLGVTLQSTEIDDLKYKFEKINENNRQLQDEKFQLQKDNVELQNKIIQLQSTNGTNGIIVEKDNRIAELESLIEELKKSNQLLEEESKVELEKQVNELLLKNDEISNKVIDLEKIVTDLESEKNELIMKIPTESKKADEKLLKLTKENEEINKGLIKMKAQHKSKVKNLQRQLESFRKVSDVNAELVRLGNQVAVLEEEKGNLQLSLVDFDELKASAGDWKEQISDLEGKVNAQTKEIQGHIDAIAALENQKLDLMQELHSVKQEISALEEENAESENLRVTAEMKVVDLEEQLEVNNKIQQQKEGKQLCELQQKIQVLTKENEELQQKLTTKGTSDSSGSTESFETLQETDRSELLKKIDEISQRNTELLKKLSTLEEEKMEINIESTELFETINVNDKTELVKRIDALTRENNELIMKLSKIEEKGSSDTGSTESFEKIPEHSDSGIKMEMLIRENNNLIIKLTKLEEKLENTNDNVRIEKLEKERNELLGEIENLKESEKLEKFKESQIVTIETLENEIESCRKLIEEQKEMMDEMKEKLVNKEEELERKIVEIEKYEAKGQDTEILRKELEDSIKVIDEWKCRCEDMEIKMNDLENGKILIEQGLEDLQQENRRLHQEAEQKEEVLKSLKEELNTTIGIFEAKLQEEGKILEEKDKEIAQLKEKIKNKEKDLTDKYAQLQNEMITIDSLQDELEQRKSDLQQKDSIIVSLTEEVNDLKVSRKWEITSAKKHIEELKSQLQLSKEEFSEKDKSYETNIEIQEEKIKNLEAQIETNWKVTDDLKIDAEFQKAESEKQINYLQNLLDSNGKYAEDLKLELNQAYQNLEQLKLKHVDDMNMQNKRLEEIIEDLQNKVQETENLKVELKESQNLAKQNVSDEIKQTLETKIIDLEQQLIESGEKSQKQLEKMKKLVANLKKKSALCEELESRVKNMEQELIDVKNEKEILNQEIMAKNSLIHEKDVDLVAKEKILQEQANELIRKESQLEEAVNEIVIKDNIRKEMENEIVNLKNETSTNIERLVIELNEARERLKILMRTIDEMEEESFEIILEKLKKQQLELVEAKDNVRELSVRMQVMETEYVEQLSIIQTLRTVNGMLSSKNTQINERLENAEKESEERKILLENVEKETEERKILLERLQLELEKKELEVVDLMAKRDKESVGHDQDQSSSSIDDSFTKCERCDQCQTLVHTLEARLQERDAQIENLDNELANSVVNFVQMQDNIRINNLGQNRSLQESYNDLMMQYNSLMATNEDIKIQLNATLQENQELLEKIEAIKNLNVSLEERTRAAEIELANEKANLQTELDDTRIQLQNLRENLENPEKLTTKREVAPLFDASKVFGTESAGNDDDESEIIRLREALIEKENFCSELSREIEERSLKLEQLEILQSEGIKEFEIANNRLKELEGIRIENEELIATQELCRFRILQLENEVKTLGDNSRVHELEERASKIQRENELFQLQVNDLMRALENTKESTVSIKSLQDVQTELNLAQRERDQLLIQVENLTLALKNLEDSEKLIPDEVEKSVEPSWVEEEGWGFNSEVTSEILPITLPNVEILQTKIDELQDQIQTHEAEKAKILEDNSNISAKCGKLIKKLKEYKFQVDNLQQQLKSRKLTSDMCDLDSMFSDEMNSQITGLEKSLADAKNELTVTLKEKENLVQRLDVLMAANERHVEMKEKQDMEMQVLELRNREISNKLEILQKDIPQDDMIQQLQDKTMALDAENQELQAALFQQKTNRLALEAKLEKLTKIQENDNSEELEKLTARNVELEKIVETNMEVKKDLDKLKDEYNVLRKQYEQSLMDANDQVQVMRQNSDLLKEEVSKRKEEFDTELENLRKESEESLLSVSNELQQTRTEKEELDQILKERIQEIENLQKESQICIENLQEEGNLQLLIQKSTEEMSLKNQEVENLKQLLLQKEEEIVQKGLDQELILQKDQEILLLKQEVKNTNEVLQTQAEEIEKLISALDEKIQKETELTQKVLILENDLQQYITAIQSHEQNVQHLQNKIIQDEHELNELRKLLMEKDSTIQEIQQELQKSQQELETSGIEIQQLIAKLQVDEQELERLNDLEENKTESYNILQLDLQTKKQELEERETNFQDLQTKLSANELIVNQLQTKIFQQEEELQRKIIEKDEEFRQKIVENEEQLRQKIIEKEEELRQMIFEKEEEHRQKIFEKDEELRQKIAEKSDLTEKGRKDSENLRKTADDVPIFRMGDDDDDNVDEIVQLRAQLSQKQLQVDHLEASLNLNTYTQIIQELQDTVNQLYNEKAHFEMTLASFSQNLKEQVSEKEQEIKALRQELEVQRQEVKIQQEVSPRMSRRKRSLDEEENQRLRDALRAWEQEVQDLRQILAEKDAQLMEDSSGVDKMMIERLMNEKEQIRVEGQENLERMLMEKETQIEEVRSRLQAENEGLLNDLKLREREIENLRHQIEEIDSTHDEQLQKKIAEIAYAGNDLAERDRRLIELSVTKDAEIQNLKLQIHDKELRIEELQALSDEEERQLIDLKMILETRDHEINELKQQIEEKLKELELIQHALRRHVTKTDDSNSPSDDNLDSSANELDLALYMLHQRDVRCEELTLELMQLLEERDTLQLRLSNAIRINEEMRRSGSPTKSLSMSSGSLPLVEDPSPSRSEGPVEIAKDALDSSIGDNKEALAQKLSQLHTVGHSKDVRLRDDRELRHTQQMSLLAHKDVLSTLPPEAAAKLINANYTISKDVPSQSSVLMNWLWGKSTPKVMHM
ncbi:uncharacterized protein LOC127289217 isoform X3 [Leptopilina boulardi]|nr:uncharacterized protein LOC127289217 isoform X3 [Leptopilina boulardi]